MLAKRLAPIALILIGIAICLVPLIGFNRATGAKDTAREKLPEPVRVTAPAWNLGFPNGEVADLKRVEPTAVVGFSVDLVNLEPRPLNLTRLRVKTPCCTPVRLLANARHLAPKESGKLECQLVVPEKSGPAVATTIVELAAEDNPKNGADVFALHVRYEVATRLPAYWSGSLDFGLVWKERGVVIRNVELILHASPEQIPLKSIVVRLDPMDESVTMTSGTARVGKGKNDQPAIYYPIQLSLDSRRALARKPSATKVVVTTGASNHATPVRWQLVDEFTTTPETLTFLRHPSKPIAARFTIRNHADLPFRVKNVTCDLDGVSAENVESQTDNLSQQVSLIVKPSQSTVVAGKVTFALEKRGVGNPILKELPCSIILLQVSQVAGSASR